jgi:ATP-binding cassette subfamily B multidrug efflux pump
LPVLDALIPIFIGTVIGLLSQHGPDRLLTEAWPQLAGMAAVLLIGRPLVITAQNLVAQQGISANFTSMIRWQGHFHVVRQGWAFFQEDFAGRIANRVMQAAPALREKRRAGRERRLVHHRLRQHGGDLADPG